MRVLLDNQPLVIGRPSLAAALAAGVAAAEERGRIIVEAAADGRALGDEDLAEPSDVPGEVQELRLVSAEPRSLVRVTLLDACDALEDARTNQVAAADKIQSGKTGEALEPMRTALATWQTVRDVVERSTAVLRIHAADPNAAGAGGVQRHSEALAQRLGELKGSLQREDWSALSDVLAYDLCEQIDEWQGMLRTLADYVMTLPGGARSGEGRSS